jgi:hypothetical protein
MRQAVALASLALLAACAPPAPPATGDAAPSLAATPAAGARIARTLDHALLIVPMSPTAAADELPPLPNRAIEAPPDRFADPLNPTLEPMLLPGERRQGVTFDGQHPRQTGPDRPFDGLLPGARLRIPFE